MKESYQVIVIGAGPSGATLADELARRGIEVLLLEKETLPRYKCCAGGITIRAAKLLSIDIQELAEDIVFDVTITFRDSNPFHGHSSEALMYTVMRDKFDCALVRKAETAGAVILQGQQVSRIREGARWVEVTTLAGDFRAQFVAGADGAYSVVARELGLASYPAYAAGIESEVLVPDEARTRWRARITFDLGRVAGGYAWVFPKLDHLSIGITCLSAKGQGLKRRYEAFLDSLNLGHYKIARWDGSQAPICKGSMVVCRGRVALLGDAAGLVDPLTGEGIYNAILSARLAAPVIEESLRNDKVGLHDYQLAIEEKIMAEMKIAYRLSGLLAKFPSLIFKLLHQDERLWRACCYLVRGETNYTTIKEGLSRFKAIRALLPRW